MRKEEGVTKTKAMEESSQVLAIKEVMLDDYRC
jgi:hypothetical protein